MGSIFVNKALAPYPKSVYVKFEIDCLKNLALSMFVIVKMSFKNCEFVKKVKKGCEIVNWDPPFPLG